MFTFIPLPEISTIIKEQNKDPSQRVAQHALAKEFVELIHGKDEANAVAIQHRQLFRPRSSTAEPTPLPRTPEAPGTKSRSSLADYITPQSGNSRAPQTNFANMPSANVTLPRSLVFNQPFNKILWSAGLVASKSEGHRITTTTGAYVGSRPGITAKATGGSMPDDLRFTPIKNWLPEKTEEFIIDGELLILKMGKWKLKIVTIVSDERFKELGLTAPGWGVETDTAKAAETAETKASSEVM